MIRLRKHRANLGRALSSGNSGFTARRYIKLFVLALLLVIVLIPVEFYYMWLNLPPHYVPYSWTRVHDPLVWGAIIFVSTSDAPNIQYNGWVTVAMSFMLFCFFGFSDEAIDVYRNCLVFCGFGLVWPSLKVPREARRRSTTGTRSTWSSHFDLVGKALSYFDTSRKPSQTTSDSTHNSQS